MSPETVDLAGRARQVMQEAADGRRQLAEGLEIMRKLRDRMNQGRAELRASEADLARWRPESAPGLPS